MPNGQVVIAMPDVVVDCKEAPIEVHEPHGFRASASANTLR